MGRWTQYDEDSTRLPEGMKRVGYDSDTRRYTFKDERGVLYQSEPGNSYGFLTPVSQAEEASLEKARPNAFEPSTPGTQQTTTRINSNLNSFEEFLPSEAIASPPPLGSPNRLVFSTSPKSSPDSPSSLPRLSDVFHKVKAIRTAASQMQSSGSGNTRHRSHSTSPPPSPPSSQRLTHRRRGYSQLPDMSRVEEKARGLFRSLTVSTRSSIESSNRRSSQPRPSRSSSRASRASVSTTSTITPMKTG